MDWYLVVPRVDSQETPSDAWVNGLRAIASGGEADTTTGVATANANTVGLTPFDNSYFCTKYKILEKRRVMI